MFKNRNNYMHKQPYDFHAYPTSFGHRGKVLLFGVRNLPSLVETESSVYLLKEENVYLPGGGSIQHLDILALKV